MKRATTINISGQLFSIDEDAEKELKQYLAELEQELVDEPESLEMMADIEASIAEHLREQAATPNDPVTKAMVDLVRERIGHISEEDVNKQKTTNSKTEYDEEWGEFFSKPVYKSRDNKVVDGVAAGLGERFEVDPLWFRVGFLVLLLMTHGFMIIVYIILALVLKENPDSSGTSKKKRKLTANAVVERVKDQAHNLKDSSGRKENLSSASSTIKKIGIVFAKAARIAVAAFLAWVLILITAVFAFMAVDMIEPGRNVPFIGLNRGGVFWVLVIAGYFAVILPILMLVISMFAHGRRIIKLFTLLLLVLWVMAASLTASAVSLKHQTMRDWVNQNRESIWTDNAFVRLKAYNNEDVDFTCVSLIGTCNDSRQSINVEPPQPPR